MLRIRSVTIMISIGCLIFFGVILIERCTPKKDTSMGGTSDNKFVGVHSCKTCHANETNDWQQSHHFMAMQPANDSTVVGNFNNATFTGDGVTNNFFKKEGKFFINTQGDDGINHDYEVKYTFGFTPLQ